MRIAVFDFGHWRSAARSLLTREVPPASIEWVDVGEAPRHRPFVPPAPPHAGHTVPRRFLELCADAATATAPDRWALMYRIAWRLTHGEPDLLERDDVDAQALEALAANTRPAAVPTHRPSASRQVPVAADPATLLRAMDACTACERCTVGDAVGGGGDGPILIVGEAPDAAAEDAGWPLVGAAGDAIGRALARAGLPVDRVRTTYAIKHRSRPGETVTERRSIADRCRPWLMAELALDPPAAIVALGEVAARGVIGRGGRRDDPTLAHTGPAGVPVFVAPALERIRLGEAAGDERYADGLVHALLAAASTFAAHADLHPPVDGTPAALARAALDPDVPERG